VLMSSICVHAKVQILGIWRILKNWTVKRSSKIIVVIKFKKVIV